MQLGVYVIPTRSNWHLMHEFPPTRWSLIARLPGQPRQAGAVIGLYAEAIGSYLTVKLAGEQSDRVDDIIQEVLVELMGKPDLLAGAEPGGGSRFRHYLMHLAWMAARNHLRHARRRDHSPLADAQDLPEGGPIAPVQQSAMDRAWALAVVQEAFDELRRWSQDGTLEPEAYAVLRAHLCAGRGLREIATELGMSLATSSRRLARARTLLQQAISERLRLAGELAPGEDPANACAVLLAALQTSG